ncbi:hypothetical protein GCM10009754_41710 [Amycolatopsis minnesotensis]|uniref:Uncharacterized protein n=1 Tax=Amycolatopsis minnesotensis TaxID=337894 RepID=A0ABN2R8D2_9PSEU
MKDRVLAEQSAPGGQRDRVADDFSAHVLGHRVADAPLLCRSITVAGYGQPSRVGRYVMSPAGSGGGEVAAGGLVPPGQRPAPPPDDTGDPALAHNPLDALVVDPAAAVARRGYDPRAAAGTPGARRGPR